MFVILQWCLATLCMCVLAICLPNHCTLCRVFPRAHHNSDKDYPWFMFQKVHYYFLFYYYIWVRKLPVKTLLFSLHLVGNHPQRWDVSSSEENVFKHFNILVPSLWCQEPSNPFTLTHIEEQFNCEQECHPNSILAILKCSISRNIQGQAERGAELPGLIEDVHCRGFGIDEL